MPPSQNRSATAARSDALDLAQLWSAVRQHYRFVLGVSVVTFALVMAVTLASRMSFRAVGRLYLGELEESGKAQQSSAANEVAITANNQGVVGSEVEIIQSRSLVSRAILDSGLNVSIVAVGQPQPRYGQWLASRRNPARLDAAADEIRATNSTLSDAYGKERVYKIRFVSDTEYEVFTGDQRQGSGHLGEATQVPGGKLTLAPGSERAPKSGAEYELTLLPLQDVTDGTLKSLTVTAPKALPPAQPVNVVTLEFSGRSPRLAVRFLDSLMAAYLNERQSWKAEDATAAENFVTNQLKKTRESLDSLQQKLAEYRATNRVVVTDNEAKAMIEQIGKYEEQRVAARLEVAELSELQRTLSGPNPSVGALLLGGTTDTVIERMATSLAEARQKLTDLDTRFNDAAPDVRAQHEQVDTQLQSIKNYVAGRVARSRENLGTIDSIIKQFEGKLNTLPGAEIGLAQLSRESDVYDRMYSFLLERQQQTAIIRASTLSKNRVLDAPEVTFREDSPKLLLRLASAPLGLLLGVFLVLARSLLASTFQSEADVKSAFEGVPVFARLPHLKRRRARGDNAAREPLDVLAGDRRSSLAEAFRMLRANLYRWGADVGGKGKVLIVTSPNDGDGKTTCVLALAALLAADGKRVLVVDADLRKANHPKRPGVGGAALGLVQVLKKTCTWAEAAQPVNLGNDQFYAIGSGGVGPAELLSSSAMAEFLSGARACCDFILLDVPSFPVASDALVLSPLADAVLSVFRLQNSLRKLAHEHTRALTGVAPIHAILINDVGVTRAKTPPSDGSSLRGEGEASPQLQKRWSALWWVSVLILAAGGAALLLFSRAPLGGFAAQQASELRP